MEGSGKRKIPREGRKGGREGASFPLHGFTDSLTHDLRVERYFPRSILLIESRTFHSLWRYPQ